MNDFLTPKEKSYEINHNTLYYLLCRRISFDGYWPGCDYNLEKMKVAQIITHMWARESNDSKKESLQEALIRRQSKKMSLLSPNFPKLGQSKTLWANM